MGTPGKEPNRRPPCAGNSDAEGYVREAFLWDPVEGMIGLGDLPGGQRDSEGWGVNNGGHVAGWSSSEFG